MGLESEKGKRVTGHIMYGMNWKKTGGRETPAIQGSIDAKGEPTEEGSIMEAELSKLEVEGRREKVCERKERRLRFLD